jgi:membrane carboxypeptidase/penicillin-binding protein PbpC
MLGIVLGAATTTLTDLVAAYTAIAFDGTVTHPTLLSARDGEERRFLISDATAATLRAILTNVRDEQQRTAASAWRPHASAFKTGTSVGFRDAWTLGIKGPFVIGVWVGTPSGAADPANTGRNRALTIASALADTLPAADAIVPWRSAPIQANEIPAQSPKLVYPSNGSRLVLLQAPNPARQLQVTLTGSDAGAGAGMDLYLNDHPIEWSEDLAIPIPHDGFYDLEIRKGPVPVERVSFSVLSGG